MRSRLATAARALFGTHPAHILYLVAPTLLAVTLDVALRARALLAYPPLEALNYFGSSLASAGVWGATLWLSTYLVGPSSARSGAPWKRRAARAGLALVFLLFILPLALFSYGGQVLYFRVFGAYMGRDTVRLGIALRGTLHDWLVAWGGPWILVALVACALPVALFIAACVRRAAPSLASTLPVLPILGGLAASTCFFVDFVETRSLQAAPPDTCFIHGVFHAVRDGLGGKGWVRHGFTLRRPAPLPPIVTPAHRPNVLLVFTESVRADAVCSDPGACADKKAADPALDAVVPDRLPLGELVTQSPGTFSASMILWTGLPPNVDLKTAHEAPVLWEVARACGYRTAYVTSQNLRYDDFGAFVERAGIDFQVSALELGDTKNAQMGAPDELATARMLDFISGGDQAGDSARPYFAVLHFSNTHAPYRVDPALQPFAPHSDDPTGDIDALHNHYRNSVALQERTLVRFLEQVRRLPGWDDTVVLYLSDHGEAFREHTRLYHINNLFEEEVRIPGWLAAGTRALDATSRSALEAYATHRTYSQDVHMTVVALLGARGAHAGFPFADLTTGRSLLEGPVRPFIALMSTETAVWEPDDPQYGAMSEHQLLVGSASATWECFDFVRDPTEEAALRPSVCGDLNAVAASAFPMVKR